MDKKNTMKAVRFHEYGGPEVLRYEDAPIPKIGSGEVLIKVAATAFNPADASLRLGAARNIIPLELPFILGFDVSGTIMEVGEDVRQFSVGDKVFGYIDLIRNGAAAEYVVSRASDLAIAPKSIALQDSAALTSSGLTAWQALFEYGDLKAGQRVLITAAAGGVGSIAVQLAKWKDAHVIATASERSFSILRKLGVDEIIDYKNESLEEKITEQVDLIFNLSPVDSDVLISWLQLVKRGGMLVSAVKGAEIDSNQGEKYGVKIVGFRTKRSAEQLSKLSEVVNQGSLKPFISERVPLEQLVSIHEKFGTTNGKILILVDDNMI